VPGDEQVQIAPAADPTWPERALASGVGVMVGRGPVPAVNEELFELLGRPGAILFEPVQRGDQDMGVLVVGWHTPPADQRRQSALIRLLAAETTFAIERADQLRGLTEIAMSDPLIGLPNGAEARLFVPSQSGEVVLHGVKCAFLGAIVYRLMGDILAHPA